MRKGLSYRHSNKVNYIDENQINIEQKRLVALQIKTKTKNERWVHMYSDSSKGSSWGENQIRF